MMQKAKTLEQIAQEINRLHGEVQGIETEIEERTEEIERMEETAQEKATRIGRLLITAKGQTRHGNWLRWLKDNCPDIDERTAQHYMAFVRGDVPNLNSGGKRNTSAAPADSDLPDEEALTDRQKAAVKLAKEGRSYRQIGSDLGIDESIVRRDPVVRRAKESKQDQSRVSGGSLGACYVRQPPEIYSLMKSEIDALLAENVTLNKEYKTKFKNLFERGLKGVEEK